jgi:hypothetical protein
VALLGSIVIYLRTTKQIPHLLVASVALPPPHPSKWIRLKNIATVLTKLRDPLLLILIPSISCGNIGIVDRCTAMVALWFPPTCR